MLLEAARQGHKGSLERLLHQFWPWIRRRAAGLVSRRFAPLGASSLTQETVLRFSRSIDKARATDSPSVKALLNRIMQNTVLTANRSASRTKRDSARQLLVELEPDAANLEKTLCDAERIQRLYAAILRLPERQRQAIQLVLEEVSPEEIAGHLQCSVGAAHMLIQRGKHQLAQWLTEMETEPDSVTPQS